MSPEQARAIPRGPDGMFLVQDDGQGQFIGRPFGPGGQLKQTEMLFGQGFALSGVIRAAVGVYPHELEGDVKRLDAHPRADYVIRAGASAEALRRDVERILTEALG